MRNNDCRGTPRGCPYWHALAGNETMIAMMGVAEQCMAMPGDGSDGGDWGNAGNAGSATTPDPASSSRHTGIVV